MQAVGAVLELDVTVSESEIIADILIELLNQAEKDIRRALSEQLSALTDAPLRLILQMANDEIDIARPILTRSKVLGDYDLVYIIKSKTAEYWQAIAERKELSDQVVNMLADTGDFDTALTLVENKNIVLCQYAAVVLSQLASGNDVLSQPLLMRPELPQDVVEHLYKQIGEELKRDLIEKCGDKFSNIVVDTVDSAVYSLNIETDARDEDQYKPSEDFITTARYHHQRGLINHARMIDCLRQGRIKHFVAQFSVYTDISLPIVISAVKQKNGRKFALICKACDINKSDFVSLYILLRSFDSQEHNKTVDVRLISSASTYYDKFDAYSAREVLKKFVK